MAAPHEADSTEDIIAREMARLTFEKVTTIAKVQHSHSRRLASIEDKLDDHSVMLASADRRLTSIEGKVGDIEGKVGDIEGKVGDIEGKLDDHGVMLRQILERLPEPARP